MFNYEKFRYKNYFANYNNDSKTNEMLYNVKLET